MPGHGKRRKAPRGRQFSYTRLEDFDPLLPEYEVIEVGSRRWIGSVRKDGEKNWEVSRPQDKTYHRAFGSQFEAACWLRDHFDDPAVFDEED